MPIPNWGMGKGSDRIDKIGRIEENILNPHIGTYLHKSICGDECGFVEITNPL